jgi:hypothetical protein
LITSQATVIGLTGKTLESPCGISRVFLFSVSLKKNTSYSEILSKVLHNQIEIEYTRANKVC